MPEHSPIGYVGVLLFMLALSSSVFCQEEALALNPVLSLGA
jgi:hypothetical protein